MKNPFRRKSKRISDYTPRTWFYRAFGMLVTAGLLVTFFSILVYRWVNPNITMLMLKKHYVALLDGKKSKIEKDWKSINKISPMMVLAAVAAEDNRFIDHWGFDFESIQKAIKSNQRSRRVKGASTISQQTAKNMFLWAKRSWVRKGLEAYFTVCMEVLWSKKRIMEVYLNIAEFGNGIYGVEAASKNYYKKSAVSLNRSQSSMLTTVLPSPIKRNPTRPSSYMVRYQQRVMWNMNNIGTVDFDGTKKEVVKKSKTKRKK